jgi:hypothetical protein
MNHSLASFFSPIATDKLNNHISWIHADKYAPCSNHYFFTNSREDNTTHDDILAFQTASLQHVSTEKLVTPESKPLKGS